MEFTPDFSGARWKLIFEREQGEIIVQELLEEIVKRSGDIVYQRYIERKVVPFAVLQAQKDIISLAEYLFFKLDPGEEEPTQGSSWLIDEEPEPVRIDSWARGAIPVYNSINSSSTTDSNIPIRPENSVRFSQSQLSNTTSSLHGDNENIRSTSSEGTRARSSSLGKINSPSALTPGISSRTSSSLSARQSESKRAYKSNNISHGISSSSAEDFSSTANSSAAAIRQFANRSSKVSNNTSYYPPRENSPPQLNINSSRLIGARATSSSTNLTTPKFISGEAVLKAREQEELEKLERIKKDLKNSNVNSFNNFPKHPVVPTLTPLSNTSTMNFSVSNNNHTKPTTSSGNSFSAYTYDSNGQILPLSIPDPNRINSPKMNVKVVSKPVAVVDTGSISVNRNNANSSSTRVKTRKDDYTSPTKSKKSNANVAVTEDSNVSGDKTLNGKTYKWSPF